MITTFAGHPSNTSLSNGAYLRSTGRRFGVTEELQDNDDYGDVDEMGELSDSPSSVHTASRPVTPSQQPPPHVHISGQDSLPSDEIFKLADKAEKILGLTPGSLSYARACLENARDEARRTADHPSPEPTPYPPPEEKDSQINIGRSGIRGRMTERARKAMSIAGMSGAGQYTVATPNVVIGAGGQEEEKRRQRRRRAADGVLYWQKEVARMEESERSSSTVKKRR